MCSPRYNYNCTTLGFCNIFDQSFTRSTHHTNNAHEQLVSAANCCFCFHQNTSLATLPKVFRHLVSLTCLSDCNLKLRVIYFIRFLVQLQKNRNPFEFLFCATEFVKIRLSLIKEGCGSVCVTELGLCTSVTL